MAMVRRTHSIAAFNVAATPHNNFPYRAMLQAASTHSVSVFFHGKQKALLRVQQETPQFIIGKLKTYIDIDPKNNWIDTHTGSQVSSEEQQQVAESIGSKRPDFEEHEFIFTLVPSPEFPIHLMVVNVTDITVTSIERIIGKIFNDTRVLKSVQPEVTFVSVTTVPDYRELDNMLNLDNIKYIKIVATRKNPDDAGFADDLFDKSLQLLHARRGSLEFTAEDKSGLQLDETTKKLAKNAACDGFVEIKGKDQEANNVDFSTKKKPLVVHVPADQPILTGMLENLVRFKLGV